MMKAVPHQYPSLQNTKVKNEATGDKIENLPLLNWDF
jgi:hypothetical protein